MTPIYFFSVDIDNPISEFSVYLGTLSKIISSENFNLISLTYIFCSDDYLLGINKQYLNHHYLTDVITFDYSLRPFSIDGEIYISLPRISENSLTYSVSYLHELQRVMIHGLLHLIGYGDLSSSQKNLMRSKENLYLAYFVP